MNAGNERIMPGAFKTMLGHTIPLTYQGRNIGDATIVGERVDATGVYFDLSLKMDMEGVAELTTNTENRHHDSSDSPGLDPGDTRGPRAEGTDA